MLADLHAHFMELPRWQVPGIVPFTSTPIPSTCVEWSYLPEHLDPPDWRPLAEETFAKASGISWFYDHPLLMEAVKTWCRRTSQQRAIKAAPLPPRGMLRVVADKADVKRGYWVSKDGRRFEATEVGQEFYRTEDSAPEVAEHARGMRCDHIQQEMMEDLDGLKHYLPGTDRLARQMLLGGVDVKLLEGSFGVESWHVERLRGVRGYFQPTTQDQTPPEAKGEHATGLRFNPVEEQMEAFSMPLVPPRALLGFQPVDPTFTWCDECLGVRGSHDPGCPNAPTTTDGGNNAGG